MEKKDETIMFGRRKYDKNGFDENGYNRLGFDKFGYNKQGYDKDGYDKRGFNVAGFNKLTGLNKEGYDKDGYDKNGYNHEGYNHAGYNQEGYNKAGYNQAGFNKSGYDKNGYDKDGYTIEGYDMDGYDRLGYTREGYDKNGYDRSGYNVDGYDKHGYNREGFNTAGYNIHGFDAQGYDVNGYDATGFNRNGYDKDGYDNKGYDKFGYDKNGFDANGYDKEGYNKLGFDYKGYDRNGYDKYGYDENGYDKTGYDEDGYDKYGYDRKGINRQGYDKKGYDRDGFNSEGYNRAGFNRSGYNKEGYDKYGFTVEGYDVDGYDIFGRDKEGYGLDGYDKQGFNQEGFNQDGFHRDDFDEYGFNKYTGLNDKGYDREGYNINGLNRLGYDRFGYNIDGFDKDGYNREGYNCNGYNRSGYDYTGYDRYGFNEEGYDRSGYNRDGFDIQGYNRLGFDKEGYDRNGLNVNGKRKALITNPSQIQRGLRIKNKLTGERGRIDGCGTTRVYYTMDKYSGTSTSTETTIDNFMKLFFLDDGAMEADYVREALYNNKVRQYLHSGYRDYVLIPAERSRVVLNERTYIDREGFWVTERDRYDETLIRFSAEAEASRLAKEAYFAHVDYKENSDLYIGKEYIPGYVIDWADKKAAYYYEYKIYTVDQQLGIKFVRDITLTNGIFSDFNDLYNRGKKKSSDSDARHASVADEKLIEIIERNRASKAIHDIVESIQVKQYEIITQDMNKSYLVLGCAGSGKTMILLHRIRYLLFNNPDIDTNSMVVVSPTNILGRESKELAKILNIEKINQCSTSNFYSDIIRDIFQTSDMFHRIEEFEICDSSCDVDSKAVASCLDIIEGRNDKRTFYINKTQKMLADEKRQIATIVGEKNLLNGNAYYVRAIKEIMTYSRNDILKIIHFATNKVEAELYTKENREYALLYLLEGLRKGSSKKEDYDENKIRKRLQHVLAHIDKVDFTSIEAVSMDTTNPVTRFVQAISLLSKERDAREIKQMIDEIRGLTYGEIEHMVYMIDSEIEQLKKLDKIREALEYASNVIKYTTTDDVLKVITIQEVIKHFENLRLFVRKIESICESINENPFVIFGIYNDIEQELQRLNNADKSNDYVFDMLIRQLGIERDKQNHKIVVNKQQLQKIFHILTEKFEKKDNRKKYLFLDEFQDYSSEELIDIQNYFSNAVINLYGDVNQCINTNGINDISVLREIMSFDAEYELKENYRNSSEITEYVNRRFGMDMYKIGLPGSVRERKIFYPRKLEENDRGAIIVADETLFEQLVLPSINVDIRFYNVEGNIHKNCYNVLTVAQAKGLEFEQVIVIDKNMSKNQLYVACTRAIRDLEIVTLS